MTEKEIQEISVPLVDAISKDFDAKMEGIKTGLAQEIDEKLAKFGIEKQIGKQVKAAYTSMKSEAECVSGLSADTKKGLNKELRSMIKAGKAVADYSLLASSGASGGFLLPEEILPGIMRISKTNGVMMNLANVYTASADIIKRNHYSKDALMGEFVGYEAGPVENADLKDSIDRTVLNMSQWSLILVVPEVLVEDATFDLVAWLMALVGEGMAARVDKEVILGSTTALPSSFKGIFSDFTYYPRYTMKSGKNAIAKFDPEEAELIKAGLEDETVNNGVFLLHPETLATIVTQRVDQGGGAGTGQLLFDQSQAAYMYLQLLERSSLLPRAFIGNQPAFTSRYVPKVDGTAKEIGVFGDFSKAIDVALRGEMNVKETREAVVNGVNTFIQDSVGYKMSRKMAIGRTIKKAITVIKTA